MIFETFAFRKKKALTGGEPEIFTYDSASPQLSHQICMAVYEGIGHFYEGDGYSIGYAAQANQYWEEIDRVCRKEIYKYLEHTRESDLSRRYLDFLPRA